jgi:hypothetical protein
LGSSPRPARRSPHDGVASDLTADEQKNVRAAIRFLRPRVGNRKALARALHVSRSTKNSAASASVALRVARLAGVGVDNVLGGSTRRPEHACVVGI